MTFGDLPHQLILVLRVGHHRRCGAKPFRIGDHGGLATLHHRHAAIRGSKVNADNFAHRCPPPKNSPS
ncbi:possible putative glutamate dehydrogenase [Synechococcus sp. RS9917]|nr:possible putative glutamate dehydrogenase [Synechococcus sp. RS9917]